MSPSLQNTQFRVYVTPRTSYAQYGTEVEISDWVIDQSITLSKSIDSTDYSVGLYTYSDVQLTCDNSDGYLGDENDSRSIFTFSRDLAKVRIVFDRGDGSPTIVYHGIINEQATSIDSDATTPDQIQFTVLGLDSVLQKSQIPPSTVTSGMSVQTALLAILDTSDITSILNVSLPNINPSNNVTIDDGTKFDNLNKNDAINSLLLASNSVFLIDANLNVIVRNRTANTGVVWFLYGQGDLTGNENVIGIQNYNTGLQRLFNSVKVTGGTPSVVDSTGQTVSQPQLTSTQTIAPSVTTYGLRQFSSNVALDWCLTQATLDSVALGIATEFAYKKMEVEVIVPIDQVLGADLLDQVSLSYPLRTTPAGKFLPVIGITKIGDTDSPLPTIRGGVAIDRSVAFKIIQRDDDLNTWQTTLKLRQVGSGPSDGFFSFLDTESGFDLTTESGAHITT